MSGRDRRGENATSDLARAKEFDRKKTGKKTRGKKEKQQGDTEDVRQGIERRKRKSGTREEKIERSKREGEKRKRTKE